MPESIFRLVGLIPMSGIQLVQKYIRVTDELARQLVAQHAENNDDDSLVSHLLRSNIAATDNATGIPPSEIPVHLRTILIAGSDTTSNTIGFILYNLARLPDFQRDLRAEIQAAGPSDRVDYEKMPLLNAIINEVLRLYPSVPIADRVATADCVLPLGEPITTTTGETISEIPVRRGQRLYVSTPSCHRLTSIWGPDAAEFKPSRWLEAEPPCKRQGLGPHASLLSFLCGPHVCLGWRFGLLEMQVFVTELVRNFVLSVPDGEEGVVRPYVAMTLMPRTSDGVRQMRIHVERVA